MLTANRKFPLQIKLLIINFSGGFSLFLSFFYYSQHLNNFDNSPAYSTAPNDSARLMYANGSSAHTPKGKKWSIHQSFFFLCVVPDRQVAYRQRISRVGVVPTNGGWPHPGAPSLVVRALNRRWQIRRGWHEK